FLAVHWSCLYPVWPRLATVHVRVHGVDRAVRHRWFPRSHGAVQFPDLTHVQSGRMLVVRHLVCPGCNCPGSCLLTPGYVPLANGWDPRRFLRMGKRFALCRRLRPGCRLPIRDAHGATGCVVVAARLRLGLALGLVLLDVARKPLHRWNSLRDADCSALLYPK